MPSMPMFYLHIALLACSCLVRAQANSTGGASVTSSSVATGVTDIPVYNASIAGTPADTTVVVVPDESQCNYTSSDDLYCFPYDNAFVTMTGWTRFFYNRNYGLINNSGLVDVTMYFAADDEPAATWIGLENTGNIPINVNISWFTSTLSPQATNSVADPYYFYVRPNSAVYNSYPTGSSVGPTFYAVQTPVQKLAVVASATSSPEATTSGSGSASSTSTAATTTSASQSSNSGNSLSKGAIAGIAIGAIALFFVLILLGIVLVLLLRRHRYAEEAAAAAALNQEKSRQTAVVPGNLFTQNELAAAGLAYAPGMGSSPGRRPSVDQTDSNDSVPVVVHEPPLTRRPSEPARIFTYARRPVQAV